MTALAPTDFGVLVPCVGVHRKLSVVVATMVHSRSPLPLRATGILFDRDRSLDCKSP